MLNSKLNAELRTPTKNSCSDSNPKSCLKIPIYQYYKKLISNKIGKRRDAHQKANNPEIKFNFSSSSGSNRRVFIRSKHAFVKLKTTKKKKSSKFILIAELEIGRAH